MKAAFWLAKSAYKQIENQPKNINYFQNCCRLIAIIRYFQANIFYDFIYTRIKLSYVPIPQTRARLNKLLLGLFQNHNEAWISSKELGLISMITWTIAREKYWTDFGLIIWDETEMSFQNDTDLMVISTNKGTQALGSNTNYENPPDSPPADDPNIVILWGSPPISSALSWMNSIAICWSNKP